MQRFHSAIMLVFALSVGTAQIANAQLFQSGGSYSVTGTNFVTDYSQNVTLDQTTKLVDNGLVTLSETLIPDGSGGEWLVFNFATVNGGPLASNMEALWRIQINNIPLATPSLYDGAFIYWTEDGTAFSPLTTFSGFNNIQPNPINPALGPVFAFPVASPIGPFSSFDVFFFATPYSAMSLASINPNTANDLHIGIHALQVPVPEPGTYALLASLGVTGAALLRRRRTR